MAMRFSSPDGRLIIEFALSEDHGPEFGFTRLILNGTAVGDFEDLTALWGFVGTLREPSTFVLESLDPDHKRIDLILYEIFTDEEIESGTLVQLGEAFDASFIRRYALNDGDQVLVFTDAEDNSVRIAKYSSDVYATVTAAAFDAYTSILGIDPDTNSSQGPHA